MKFIADDKIPFLRGRLEKHAEVVYASHQEFTKDLVAGADALIIRTRTKCDASLLMGSSVRFIATATIGTDHIDLEWCCKNGITVRNAAGCNAPGVAQYVWSSLLRHGFDPDSSTLGIVGCGNVGSIVADWGERLGCRLLVCDPPKKQSGMPGRDYVDLGTVLREADAVTLHTPLSSGGEWPTFHMIGERELSVMKHGSILINSSRGPVVDGNALERAVSAHRVRAFLDVWENEPEISPTLLDAVEIATPHIAGYSYEGKQRATRMVLEAIGESFGFSPDTEGLCGDYRMPSGKFGEEERRLISESYNPDDDTRCLRSDPGGFENMRSNCTYRSEPRFNTPAT